MKRSASSSARRQFTRRLHLEPLEDRTLLSVALGADSGSGPSASDCPVTWDAVVHDSSAELFGVDFPSCSTQFLGNLGAVMRDMAYYPWANSSYVFYGVAGTWGSDLYRITVDPCATSGNAVTTTWCGQILTPDGEPVVLEGLAFDGCGTLFGAGSDLNQWGYWERECVFTIDLNTCQATNPIELKVGAQEFLTAGDIDFDTKGILYVTTQSNSQYDGALLKIPNVYASSPTVQVACDTGWGEFRGLTYDRVNRLLGYREQRVFGEPLNSREVRRIDLNGCSTDHFCWISYSDYVNGIYLDDVYGAATRMMSPHCDFGDAPDPSYPTLFANDGARHRIVASNLFLGAKVDAELDGQPDPNALGDDQGGDDDDDGVVFSTALIPGGTAQISVTASAAGKLDAWIDFNSDGDWDDSGEKIFSSRALQAGSNPNLSFSVPSGANLSNAFARFRFSSAGGLNPNGFALDGEVEDYRVSCDPEIDVELGPANNVHSHNFGNVNVGSSASQTFTIRNEGACTLTVSRAVGLGPRFSIAPTNGTSSSDDWIIAPGATKTFTVTFSPTLPQNYIDTLTLVNDDPDEGNYQIIFSGTGVAGEIDVELPSQPDNVHSYDFGTVNVGTSNSKTFTVRNEGSANLRVSQASGLIAPFSISPTNGSGSGDDWILLPSATRTFTVTYAPTSPGSHSGTLTLVSDDPDEGSYAISLTGTALGPDIDVELPSQPDNVHMYAFGDVKVGFSASQAFTVRNEGGATLTVSQASGLAAPFSVSPANGSGSTDDWIIAPSATMSFTASFAPTSTGSQSGMLTLVSDDPDEGSYPITLSGKGVTPEINVKSGGSEDVHSHGFGDVNVGSSGSQTFTVHNEGTATLIVGQASGLAAPFSISPTNGSGSGDDWAIAPSGTKDFTVTYAPTALGSHSDTLTLVNDDLDEGTYQIGFSGKGVLPEIDVESGGSDDVHSHDFGSVNVGSGGSQSFTVRNEGDGPLTVSQASGLAVPFSITPTNGTGSSDDWVIAPGATQTFTVTFSPASVGSHSDTLTLLNDDPDEGSYPISLSGTGIAPEIDVELDSDDNVHAYDFGDVDAGTSAFQAFTVRNEGTAPLTVSQASGLGPFSVIPLNGSGSSDDWIIPPDGTQTFTVAFVPPSGRVYSETLTLLNDDPDEGSYPIVVSGKGIAPEIDVELPSQPDGVHSYDFGGVNLGKSKSEVFTVRNEGTDTLTVSQAWGLAAPFSIVPTNGTGGSDDWVLGPDDTKTFTVTFSPTSLGSQSDTLILINDDPDEASYPISLFAEGVTPEIDVELGADDDVHSHDFGSVNLGAGKSETFTVHNEGDGTLTVSQASGLAAPFSVIPTNDTGTADDWIVGPGATKTFTVTFSPTSRGSHSDTLTLVNDDADEGNYQITLSGSGIAGEIDVELPSQPDNVHSYDFGTVRVGTSLSQTFTVRNEGEATLTVTEASGLGAPFVIDPVNGSGSGDDWIIPSSMTETFSITFAPTALTAYSEVLTLSSDDPDEGSYQIAITGLGGLVPNDLGTIDFELLADETPQLGQLAYGFTALRDGIVSARVTDYTGSCTIGLYDASGILLDADTGTSGVQVDDEATAGDEFVVRVTGLASSADVRLGNLLQPVSGPGGIELTVYGTDSSDVFAATYVPGGPHELAINGLHYQSSDLPDLASVIFQGAAGSDTATLIGSDQADLIQLSPDSATIETPDLGLSASQTETIHVDGAGGDDHQWLDGDGGEELLRLWPLYGTWANSAGTYRHTFENVETVEATAYHGDDTAQLYDSDGDDTFYAGADYVTDIEFFGTTLAGDSFLHEAGGFGSVYAYSRTGGTDTAHLYDSPSGKDTFIGKPGDSTLAGPRFYYRALDFEQVHAHASATDGFENMAKLYDSDGDDVLHAGPTSPEGTKLAGTTLAGWSFSNAIDGFRYVLGYARNGGTDVAHLYDSDASRDHFVAKLEYTKLFGPGFYSQAEDFDEVHGHASAADGFRDAAWVFDSDGDDTFYAGPSSPQGTKLSGTTLGGQSYSFSADGFRNVYAYAQNGGSDTAELYDSDASLDYFVGTAGDSAVHGPDFYCRAVEFEQVAAHASVSDGFANVAKLYDSDGNDTFYAGPTSPEGTKLTGVTLGGVSFSHSADGFAKVYAYSKHGGSDAAELYDADTSLDTFVAKPTYGVLYGDGFYNLAALFEQVTGHASADGFDDRAKLFDSNGDDTFYAGPSSPQGTTLSGTTLAGQGFANAADGFLYVNGYATSGGYDHACLYGLAGTNDVFRAYLDAAHAELYDGATFRSVAKGFEKVTARGLRSDNDQAFLFDSSGSDHLEADAGVDPSLAVLTGAGREIEVDDFSRVKATRTTGNDTKHEVPVLDFVLQAVGDWTEI